jgi:hypothetical protein
VVSRFKHQAEQREHASCIERGKRGRDTKSETTRTESTTKTIGNKLDQITDKNYKMAKNILK